MLDLFEKYDLSEHEWHINASKEDGYEKYAKISYALEEACEVDDWDSIKEAVTEYATPKNIYFTLYEDSDNDYFGSDGTPFSCSPYDDNGKTSDFLQDFGICCRFDYLASCTSLFDDVPFELENFAESQEVAHAPVEIVKAYFESKGFKVFFDIND